MAEGSLPPGLSPGEKAVSNLLEGIALGLALTGVEMLLLHGASLVSVGPIWVVSLLVSYTGFKWPDFKSKLWSGFASRLEQIASSYRFRVGALLLVVLGISCYLMFYLHELRRDLDAYMMPRVITEEQAAQIRKVLQAHNPETVVNLVSNAGDPEAAEYAAQLTNAIVSGGWEVAIQSLNPWGPQSIEVNSKLGRAFDNMWLAMDQGVLIRVGLAGQPQNANPQHPTPAALLASALRTADIQFGSGEWADRGKYTLILEVGHRPRSIGSGSFRDKLILWLTSRN
jgi:hypothetical protein